MYDYIYSLFTHSCDIVYCAVQVDGECQHDGHEIEDIENTHEPKDFVSEIGPSTNMASFKNEMEGVAV